jgi:hypothetical protein
MPNEKPTIAGVHTEVKHLTQEVHGLAQEVQNLARITANGFAEIHRDFAKKSDLNDLRKDMQNGFSLVMEELRPVRRDYTALKDDLAPDVANHEIRISKLEHKAA